MEIATAARAGTFTASAPVRRYARGESHRMRAALVGVLFLTATATFSVGSSLIGSYFSGSRPATSTLLAGVSLEVCAALAGAGIGLAMLALLRRRSVRLARSYLALRVLECAAILTVGAYMLATKRDLHHYELLIYPFTACAGLIVSYLLYVSRLVPRALAKLGIGGYIVLLIGIPVALTGVADLDTGWGIGFLVPGGLFELILPVLLIVKGFSIQTAARR